MGLLLWLYPARCQVLLLQFSMILQHKHRENFVQVNGAAQGLKIKHMPKYFARPGPVLTKIKLLF